GPPPTPESQDRNGPGLVSWAFAQRTRSAACRLPRPRCLLRQILLVSGTVQSGLAEIVPRAGPGAIRAFRPGANSARISQPEFELVCCLQLSVPG
ncbi:hypothetical protein LCGC14_1088770, partial [marine sediment metagenome]